MISKRKIPKFLRIMMLLCVMFVFIAAYLPKTIVSANNHTDKLYEFWNYNDDIVAYPCTTTPFREKQDASSAYAYNDKSDQDMGAVHVMGSNNENGSGAVDLTAGNYRDLPLNQARFFPNYVHERGYTFAGFDFYPMKKTFYIHIWWSPDSI